MSIEYRFLRPVDVLYLRGNRLFGEAGEHAEASMPPWPSLFSGALRSRMLVDAGIVLRDFASGKVPHPILGTPDQPGALRIAEVTLARVADSKVERYLPLPADLVVFEGSNGRRGTKCWEAQLLEPLSFADMSPVLTSSLEENTHIPILRASHQKKPEPNLWLREAGFSKYLRGEVPESVHFVPQARLWQTDPRLGIGLDLQRRTAEQGRIYTTDAVAPLPNVGFLVGVAGAEGALPREGLVRLGGDGRGATIEMVEPGEILFHIPQGPRFRMILATPDLFPNGWLPPGVVKAEGEHVLIFKGLKARLLAASVPRHQVVSGWDVARGKPKPAERVVPAGSVYWFEVNEGETQVLEELLDQGLWPLVGNDAAKGQRRAEGFNNIWFGDWK